MANYKAKGIILKRSNFGEADRLLTIFTDRFGKIKAIAKGIRKQSSKLSGHLEPFCLSSLVIAEGRNFDIITESEIINCYFSLRNDLSQTNISYYISELVDKFTAEKEKHEDIFELLKKTLENINISNKEILLPYFELNILAAAGFYPELHKCLKCSQKITMGENYFDFEEGGLVCGDCKSRGQKVSDEGVKLLRLFLKHDISVINRIKLSEKQEKELGEIVKKYLKHIHQFEFNSSRFI